MTRAAASAQLMIRVAAEFGVSNATCIAGTGLRGLALDDPSHEIDGHLELAVIRNILRALPPDVPFALRAGQRYRIATHGMWGFAVISSANLRKAIDVGLRYFDLSYSFNRVSLTLEPHVARLQYDDSDNPEDLRAALVERDLAALATMHREILGRPLPVLSLELRAPRPEYSWEMQALFGVAPLFGCATNAICLSTASIDAPGPLADDLGLRVCEEQCRALLAHRRAQSGVAGRVRARVLSKPGEFPGMNEVAAELGMSTRTLRNHLSREGTSYRELLDAVRKALASELLASTRLSVEAISERLGYADASSFITAFKRWCGVSPRGYRTEQLGNLSRSPQ